MTPQQLEAHLSPFVPGTVRVYEIDRVLADDGCEQCGDFGGLPVVLTGGELLIDSCTLCVERVLPAEFGEYIDSPAPIEIDVEVYRLPFVLAVAA